MKVKITGMKASKGTMDNGQAFDSTKAFVETRMDESKGNMKGFASAEYVIGTADEINKYKHLPFPFFAEVEFDQITNGKAQKTVIVSIQPIEISKPAAPAAPGRAAA